MVKTKAITRNIDLWLVLFILVLVFTLPVIYLRSPDGILWPYVIKIWRDKFLLIPLFALNHWLLVPKLALKKSYSWYFSIILLVIFLFVGLFYTSNTYRQFDHPPQPQRVMPKPPPEADRPFQLPPKPLPVPPYADLLLFSLLIVAVDTGLSLSKNWHKSEEEKVKLEKENSEAQLTQLRNQVSPHFLMNTLNNIYGLIDADKEKSQDAIMKLSRLMRYMLYENKQGRVKLSKELEFIKSYVELMRLRYTGGVQISLKLPDNPADTEIPASLFISFVENAFKYGASYQEKSFIEVQFKQTGSYLHFVCRNSVNQNEKEEQQGGLGLENAKMRLDLLYGTNYELYIENQNSIFTVELKIPMP